MFYRPNFCCSCGEKIERASWTLFTSRRFCELCETEKKEYDYFVRGVIAISLVIGLAGAAGLIGGNNSQPGDKSVSDSQQRTLKRQTANSLAPTPTINPILPQAEDVSSQPSSLASINERPSTQASSVMAEETVFFCGAVTKKGTRCTRRVKTKGALCWQHAAGRLAMTAKTMSALAGR